MERVQLVGRSFKEKQKITNKCSASRAVTWRVWALQCLYRSTKLQSANLNWHSQIRVHLILYVETSKTNNMASLYPEEHPNIQLSILA